MPRNYRSIGFQVRKINARRRISRNYVRFRRRGGGHIVIGPHGGLIEFLGSWHSLPKMPYDVIDGVFVEKDLGRMYPGWERMPSGKAKLDGRKIIKCTYGAVYGQCNFAAVLLDPDWPLSDKLNRCSRHGRMDQLGLKNKPRELDRHAQPRIRRTKQTYSPRLPVH